MQKQSKAHRRQLRDLSTDPVLGILAAACCLVIIAAGLSCSNSDNGTNGAATTPDSAKTESAPPVNIISDADVGTTRKGSPQRALFQFFQAVQFQDIDAIRPLVTRRARRDIGHSGLEAAVAVVGPAVGKPQLFDVRRSGDRATVRLLLLGFTGGRDKAVSSQPATFSLVRSKGKWMLTNLRYLVSTGNDITEERRQAKRAR